MTNPTAPARLDCLSVPLINRPSLNAATPIQFGPSSALIISPIIAFISVALTLSSYKLNHWFLVPVSACKILIGSDAID